MLKLKLEPNKTYGYWLNSQRLTGFGAGGRPVEPISLDYQVTGEELAAADRAKTAEGAKDVHTLNVSFCDPFELMRKTPAQAAADLGLRLVVSSGRANSPGHLLVLEAWELRPALAVRSPHVTLAA